MDNYLIVLGMAMVTYLPRMLPLTLLRDLNLPPYWQAFFSFIPYAALGSLIFPNVLGSTSTPSSAAFGSAVAVALAYCRGNLILVVAGGILAVFLWETMLGL